MSQRLSNTTKWLWYLLALEAGLWSPVCSVTVKTPPSNPSTVEAQAKFFQDFFSVQLSPYKMEFGHVCEDPNTWEQRYERKDFKNHRDMGKVRWGDKKGGYGEHYWDLNHAGHTGNHGDDGYDDGSYHEPSNSDSYDDHNDNTPNYGNDEYSPGKSSYEESGRIKRAHPKVRAERKPQKPETDDEDEPKPQNKSRKHKEQVQTEAPDQEEEYEEEDEQESYEKPKPKRQQHRKQEENPPPKDKNQLVLVVSQKDDSENQPTEYVPKKQPEFKQFVPYEGGAGVRQHQQQEVSTPRIIPRLFLDPSTGHVVDRATGQAYVLQPIAVNNYN